MQFSLRETRQQILKEGALLQVGSLSLPYEQVQRIKGCWEPLRQKKNLCTLRSVVERKISQKHLRDHN